MAKVGAQRAAELTGKSKSTIQRAMKSGKLSFELDNNDRRVIDVSELERVYGLVAQSNESANQATATDVMKEAEQLLEIERLKMQVKLFETQLDEAREQINDLKAQRDQWQKQAQQVLITSQFSQDQAKSLKDELDKRKKEAIAKRQAYEQKKAAMQRKIKTIKPENENSPQKTAQNADASKSQLVDFWQKLRGQKKAS